MRVKVIGILTVETVPGLNRQLLKCASAALSRMGLPILCPMLASVTLPLGINRDDANCRCR